MNTTFLESLGYFTDSTIFSFQYAKDFCTGGQGCEETSCRCWWQGIVLEAFPLLIHFSRNIQLNNQQGCQVHLDL